ncbi:hypothetical protein NDU88_009695 [Pleurodeles waltl]|uniref:Uncharacterized protein n=1 Tax=Pleurodeles waltl TaxID=8319 RepID=A0AAV7PXX6_PLEWA|nr:hypothetical protein NDU88_009695 [Pleurodeles waltl]
MASQCTSVSAALEALQIPRGKRSPAPCGTAAGSTPRHEEAGSTACTALQSPPLQRGEAADNRRPPPSHRSASYVLAGEFYRLGPRRSGA